ncbi:MAG: cellulase family glycosylhydrolase [Ardenticatenaceae bacterium]|nr:cellulase family glycosylhydrolase [Ardenticatenaceae bacterium]HBY99195.1 hypothetical protein [Chloroflexota bacterium]
MRRRSLFFLSLILLLAFFVSACGGTATPSGPTEATIARSPIPTFTSITPGEQTATPEPEATAEKTAQPSPAPSITATVQVAEATATATQAPVVRNLTHPFDSPEYGMQAFLWWRPEVADRDLGLIRDAGFGWVKQDFPWREIEGGGKGQFAWERPDKVVELAHDKFGLNILARVDRQPAWATGGRCGTGIEMGPPDNLQDWADFLTTLASRYKGRIAGYAVWNEPNLAREWCGQPPDPAGYMKLLQTAYKAIKAADPNAIVISAGLSPTGGPMPVAMEDTEYLDKMYQAAGGSMTGYADVVGVHAPGYKAPPELSPEEVMADPDRWGHGRYFTFRRVEDLRAIMEKYGDTDRQVAILEMGWTTDPRPESPYHWHAVTEAQQAEYLVRAFQYAKGHWRPWIGLMTVIYVCNVDWTENDEQYYWCITEPIYPQTITRPAYDALAEMPK